LGIEDLHVSVDGNEILRGVSIDIGAGQLHALMGPNGSGKSTLAKTLLADPGYQVTAGRIRVNGEDVTALSTAERAARGLFLGFQHPAEIPGVSVLNFLRQAMAARQGIQDLSVLEVRMALLDWTKRLGTDDRFAERYLNEGFSGGEKKRNEILQMALLEHLTPDRVHILLHGRIVASGGPEIADRVEREGFDGIRREAEAAA